jgi:hypothetical protein
MEQVAAMTLDVGNTQIIKDPSAEQIGHYLAFMPPQARFVILSASDDFYIQACPESDRYRVEYREQSRQYFTLASLEEASHLFHQFRSGDGTFRAACRWRRLRWWNDQPRLSALTLLSLFILIMIAACVTYLS